MTGAIGPLAPDNARGGLHGIAWSREIQVDKDAAEPLYQQLYTQIRDLIRSGRFGDGTRLPASRRLAQGLGVSRNTVVLAYQRLQEDGYVRGMAGGGTVANATSGRGTRSADRSDGPPAATARGDAISAGPGPLNSAFPVGVPPVDLFPAGLWATLTSRRLRVSGERLLLGTGNAGHRSLRKAV